MLVPLLLLYRLHKGCAILPELGQLVGTLSRECPICAVLYCCIELRHSTAAGVHMPLHGQREVQRVAHNPWVSYAVHIPTVQLKTLLDRP